MDFMEFIEGNWLIFSIVCGFVAKSIGRSFWKYFFLSLFLSPIIGFVVLLIKGKKTEVQSVVIREKVSEETQEPNTRRHHIDSAIGVKYCSACGERVETNARYCSNCGKAL